MSEGFTLYLDDPYPSQRRKCRAEVQHEEKASMIYSAPVHVTTNKKKKTHFLTGHHSRLSLLEEGL